MARLLFVVALLAPLGLSLPTAHAGYDRTFEEGSLIIPMDLAYQDRGLFQAYGLVFQLLRQGVTVYWVIDPEKTWHDAPCDTAGDECAWDCAEEGASEPCPYPTASPDFFAGAEVVWTDEGEREPGETIASHGYRGGPFVIAAEDADAAIEIIDAWNDPERWDASPWARRTIASPVAVHRASAPFEGHVRKEMIAAPTIAVFSDGNEDIATGYLRAAGIPQSDGSEFPEERCGDGDCGPTTANPDMLTVESIMGDMGTCDAPNTDHRNGSLFTADGAPAYCQIMSMHWGVNDRETVECDGGRCPDTAEECDGETFTYHGHEVVAEVRQFLQFPTHFFAECQAVNAYENTVPNPDWPYLDDEERLGHFLTTQGMPPDCPCTDGDFECVEGGCDGRDCCLPRDDKERGAGFLIADQPNSDEIQILSPEVPYNQLDGAFETEGGSEPAYNLSEYLGTAYISDADVTFITGPEGPGLQDVWMTGYVDGVCDIRYDEFATPGMCDLGKVSYLGGHRYATDTPVSENGSSQGTRLFLNALFEADCVTTAGQPALSLAIGGPAFVDSAELPTEVEVPLSWSNGGIGVALDGELVLTVPDGLAIVGTAPEGVVDGSTVRWELGSIGPSGSTAPPGGGTRTVTLRFEAEGAYALEAELAHRVGVSAFTVSASRTILVSDEPAPADGGAGLDGSASAGDGGAGDGGDGGDSGGCGCRVGTARAPGGAAALLGLGGFVFLRRTRRRRARGSRTE